MSVPPTNCDLHTASGNAKTYETRCHVDRCKSGLDRRWRHDCATEQPQGDNPAELRGRKGLQNFHSIKRTNDDKKQINRHRDALQPHLLKQISLQRSA